MSPREAKLYELLYTRRADPVSPTISDICRELQNKSRSSVWAQLQMLEKAGYISIDRRGAGRRNIIRITAKRPPGFGQTAECWMLHDGERFYPGQIRFVRPKVAEGDRYGGKFLPVTITIEERRP